MNTCSIARDLLIIIVREGKKFTIPINWIMYIMPIPHHLNFSFNATRALVTLFQYYYY